MPKKDKEYNMKKITSVLLLTACFTVLSAAVCFAANYDYIDSVSFSLTYEDFVEGDYSDDGNVTVTINGSDDGLYDVDSTSMSVPSSGWSAGDQPNFRVTFIVKDEDDYRFSREASRRDGIDVDGGEAHYAELRSSGRKLYVEVYLNEVGEDPDSDWDDDRQWSDDGESTGGPGANQKHGAWLQNPETKRWWYVYGDGSHPAAKWEQINGKWYYFDQSGFAIQNTWIKWQEKWYYCGPECDMYVNRKTPDGYYVDKNGVWDGKPKS